MLNSQFSIPNLLKIGEDIEQEGFKRKHGMWYKRLNDGESRCWRSAKDGQMNRGGVTREQSLKFMGFAYQNWHFTYNVLKNLLVLI